MVHRVTSASIDHRRKATTQLLHQALARRAWVSDSTLLDMLDLSLILEDLPATIATDHLAFIWHCSQSTVSRRLSRLWEAELIDYRPGRGSYRIRRLGPA